MPDARRSSQEPYRLLHLCVVDSTSAEAMRRAEAGERGALWIVADRQTHGRGRLGRSWQSAPGNLYASLLLELGCEAATAQQLALVAGVAAIEALARHQGQAWAGKRPRLKWPNDILLDAAKLGGILIESTTLGPRRIAVVGIGINLVSAPEGLGRAATHMSAHGPAPTPPEALSALAGAMQHWLGVWREGAGFERIRSAWIERAGTPGEPITITTGTGQMAGWFVGLDASGALLLRDELGREHRFAFGEVSLIGAGEQGR